MKTKAKKIINFLKRGILLVGISLLLWNCQKDGIIEAPPINNKYTEVISLQDLLATDIFKESNIHLKNDKKYTSLNEQLIKEKNTSKSVFLKEKKRSNKPSNIKSSSKIDYQTPQYQIASSEVASSFINGQTTYSVPIKRIDYEEIEYDENLVIEKNERGIKKYIFKTPKNGGDIIIQKIVDTKKDIDHVLGYRKCTTITVTRYTPPTTCPCAGHTYNQVCNCKIKPKAGGRSTKISQICYIVPVVVTIGPGGTPSPSKNSGNGTSSPKTLKIPKSIYIYKGKERYYPDGTCTPPLYIPGVSEPPVDLNKKPNYLGLDLGLDLTFKQIEWLSNHKNTEGKIIDFLKTNKNSTQVISFAKQAINALINGIEVDWKELYIAYPTPDDNYIYQGAKQFIPSPLTLSNGDKVNITFITYTSDNKSSNQQVATELVNGMKFALEKANKNLQASDKITSINVYATTNGKHTGPNHPNGTAVDINRINGKRMALTGLTIQIKELQNSFDNFPYIRENFGPYFKHKFSKEKSVGNQWNYNYPVGNHKDHIHISIRK